MCIRAAMIPRCSGFTTGQIVGIIRACRGCGRDISDGRFDRARQWANSRLTAKSYLAAFYPVRPRSGPARDGRAVLRKVVLFLPCQVNCELDGWIIPEPIGRACADWCIHRVRQRAFRQRNTVFLRDIHGVWKTLICSCRGRYFHSEQVIHRQGRANAALFDSGARYWGDVQTASRPSELANPTFFYSRYPWFRSV
jgi:hypothetical protein